jgi:hypothetical protein
VSGPDMRAVRRLQWLLDAPLFVDEALVDKLFDAVVRPEFEVQSREVGHVSEKAHRTLFGAELGVGYKLGLSFLTGRLDMSAKGSAERERSDNETKSTKVVEAPVVTTGRRLEEIAAVYISEHPERVVFLDTDGTATTFAGEKLSLEHLERSAEAPPRILAFVEVAPNTPIMPMSCELLTGRTRLLYEDYERKAFEDPAKAPEYPPDHLSTPETRAATGRCSPRRSRRTLRWRSLSLAAWPRRKESRSASPGSTSECRSAVRRLCISTACRTVGSTPASSDTTLCVADSGKGCASSARSRQNWT